MSRVIAGVELGQSTARIALVAPKPQPTVVRCEEINVQPGEEARLPLLVAQSLQRLGAKKADVHLCFTPSQSSQARHHLFTAPRLRKGELQQVAVRELKRDAAIDPAKSFFSVHDVEPVELEGGAKALRYLAVALARDPVGETVNALLEQKLVVRTATSSAIGLLRAGELIGLEKQGVVAIVQLDPRRSTLIVLDKGVPRFFRDIPTAFGKAARDSADEGLLAQAFAREIDISLVYFAQQNRPKQVDTILLLGDEEMAERVGEWLEGSHSYNVQRFAPGGRLAASKDAPESLLPFAAAIGVAAASPRQRKAADLLPGELHGRPERLAAVATASLVCLACMAAVLHLRDVSVARLEQETARLERAERSFRQLEPRVNEAARVDEAATRSDRWQSVFEDLDTYHKRMGQLLYNLPQTMPARARLHAIVFTPAKTDGAQPQAAPPPAGAQAGAKDVTQKVHLEGVVRAGDLQSAQADLRQLVRESEGLPTVAQAELLPVKAPEQQQGIIELPFVVDLAVKNPFPGGAR